MNSDRFNIEARAEGPANPDLTRGPMLPMLLEEWFYLLGLVKNWRASRSPLAAVIPRLGLKLQPAKGAVEFLVIDHVEKPAVDR